MIWTLIGQTTETPGGEYVFTHKSVLIFFTADRKAEMFSLYIFYIKIFSSIKNISLFLELKIK